MDPRQINPAPPPSPSTVKPSGQVSKIGTQQHRPKERPRPPKPEPAADEHSTEGDEDKGTLVDTTA